MSNDYAASLAIFLTEKTGSCMGEWRGRMTAQEQRGLFGRFLGKGLIEIDGATETLTHSRKVCFGLDSEDTHNINWRTL